jgi:hypothetical protein
VTITFNDDVPVAKVETVMHWITRLTDLMNITAVQILDPVEAPTQETGDEPA